MQFARPAPLHLQPLQLGTVLEKVVAFMKTDADRRGVRLDCAVKGSPTISGDQDQLRQVFMNLALNALDAAGAGGEVRISCKQEPGSGPVVVAVDDTGPGVAKEVSERIFEPFFTTKAQGSGLGLPITNAIVNQHGGRIEVSKGPLGGARFSVVLPRG